MSKRKRPIGLAEGIPPVPEEEIAEAELQNAILAAKFAPKDEDIGGLGDGTAMVHFDVPAVKALQYKKGIKQGEKPLLFLYLCIRGLGETPRLMLAECGAAYCHLASPMGENQNIACEWRKRSPNGLTPMLSGLGIPRDRPICQSGTIVRYLANRYGMAGESEDDQVRADMLYQTVKDLSAKKSEIMARAENHLEEFTTAGAKGPVMTAENIVAMLEEMPDVSDPDAALNYGQMELLNLLLGIEEDAPGSVRSLSEALDDFRAAAEARPRIANYLKSPMRFPAITPSYRYKKGAVKRSALAL